MSTNTCKAGYDHKKCPIWAGAHDGCGSCRSFMSLREWRLVKQLVSFEKSDPPRSKPADPKMLELRMQVLRTSLELLAQDSQPVVYRHFKGHCYIVEGFDWDATHDYRVIRYHRFGDTGPNMKHYVRTPEDFFSLAREPGTDNWLPRFYDVTPV